MSPTEFEEFVQEWAHGALGKRYAVVQRAAGSGDMGRDVVGFASEPVAESPWDNFQCKHYDHPLAPTDVWTELGKLCLYTFRGAYTVPRQYRFVSPQGVGSKLQRLLLQPTVLRAELLKAWDKHCARKITDREVIPLQGAFGAYVARFDFSIIGYVEPLTLIEQHRETPQYHTPRFGGGLVKPRPDPPQPPTAIEPREARYVEQLLGAYADYLGRDLPTVDALATEDKLRAHLARQREAFYRAESLREFEKDSFHHDHGFAALTKEIYAGVVDICEGPHASGFDRVKQTTAEARRLQILGYALANVLHLEDRVGVCHLLANDNHLRWVPE